MGIPAHPSRARARRPHPRRERNSRRSNTLTEHSYTLRFSRQNFHRGHFQSETRLQDSVLDPQRKWADLDRAGTKSYGPSRQKMAKFMHCHRYCQHKGKRKKIHGRIQVTVGLSANYDQQPSRRNSAQKSDDHVDPSCLSRARRQHSRVENRSWHTRQGWFGFLHFPAC
jgi:hypothetical protein